MRLLRKARQSFGERAVAGQDLQRRYSNAGPLLHATKEFPCVKEFPCGLCRADKLRVAVGLWRDTTCDWMQTRLVSSLVLILRWHQGESRQLVGELFS